MVEIAQDELRPPDLQVQLLRSTGDTITVQVLKGVVPLEPDAVLYVQRRGAYEISRRELWPDGRVMLTLAATWRVRSLCCWIAGALPEPAEGSVRQLRALTPSTLLPPGYP